ncbi:MAG: leucine-rich repeat domain-containing protein [Muribaculaceae bacterium]|nr:leucine-rich repeat domain-containing protein [Muribaculaceae bacterium]
MKHYRLKFLTLSIILGTVSAVNAFASDFQYQGLNYTIVSESRKICRLDKAPEGEKYSGDITVPETVENEGSTYTVESIEQEAFRFSAITSLIINAKISVLPKRICYSCNKLETIELPDGLEEIDEGAFYNCHSLVTVNLPQSLKILRRELFYACRSLKEIIIPDGAEIVDAYGVCYGCESLMSFHFPENYTSKVLNYNDMFNGCASLTEVTGCENIRINAIRTFSGCKSLNKIVIPHLSSNIENECYSGCIGLENIDFTSFIKDIEAQAFEWCSNLKSLTFGENFKGIGNKAFNQCFDIQTITCKNPEPVAISESAFTNTVYNNAVLIVPWRCADKYRNCAGWNLFKNIVETADVVEARTISFAENQLEMVEGKSLKIEATILPADASHFRIEWSASSEITIEEEEINKNIASCKVTPTKEGTYVLTVKCISDLTDEVLCQNMCVLTVKANILPTSMSVEISSTEVEVYQPVIITWTISPENYTEKCYINIGDHYTGIDPRIRRLSFYAEHTGTYDVGVSLVSAESGETLLYEPLELEVVHAGGIFDCGEGVIKVLVNYNGIKASIKANEGYTLHSVMENGIDVTAQFADEALVPVKSFPNFKIVFEKKEEGEIHEAENSNLKVLHHGNVIEVTGTKDENSPVTIYDEQGRVLIQTNRHEITLTTKGVHILLIEGRTFKFIN